MLSFVEPTTRNPSKNQSVFARENDKRKLKSLPRQKSRAASSKK